MTEKSEALRLADALETRAITFRDKAEAATELRRLVAENERLHQINQSHEMKLSVRGYEIQIADLKAVNQGLLEALKRIADPRNIHFAGDAQVVARAAIARAEGEQT
jgi:hypothetical protein